MRIIAGRYKGRRLEGPGRLPIRPTSDRLRETLFNVLADRVREARVLDAYAGTGLVGLEAISRGAAHVTFVEADRRVGRLLRANLAALGADAACTVVAGDFLHAAPPPPGGGESCDLLFLDPPYDVEPLDAVLHRAADWAAPGALVVLEHARRRPSPEIVGNLHRRRVLEAGDSALSFYGVADP